jgi:ankyrin repeat protein
MRIRLVTSPIVLALALAGGEASTAASPSENPVRQTAMRAVPPLQAMQATWYEKQTCFSCHTQFQPAIAFDVARAHGIPVNEAIARADAVKAFRPFGDVDTAVEFANSAEPALVNAYGMVAAHAAGLLRNLATAIAARVLISIQKDDGSWAGVNQRPPSSSSDFAKTALAMRAVQLYRHERDDEAAREVVARAKRWLESHRTIETEDRTYQLLGLAWGGANVSQRRALADAFFTHQNADGGWGSLDRRASEAYSTGEALYALRAAGGVPISDSRWQRGIRFLVNTQAADGTWHVPSRLHDPVRLSPPYFESGYPYGHNQFISAAGAGWALMALSVALPDVTPRPRAPLVEAEPREAERWIEPLVFGDVNELEQLIEKGLVVNASTTAGTSALMMVAGDPVKARVLIDHGANVNAVSGTGFTPLMAAAESRQADAAVQLLLDRGATVQTRTGDRPSPQYALARAARRGNIAVMHRLAELGEPANARHRLNRVAFAVTPMVQAIKEGNTDVVRGLLDLGAALEGIDGQPWTPLEVAVQNNRLDIARLLIDRGANVNARDKAGYTALLVAVSIDFGDTAMIDLLLAAGADRQARNADGKSALDLATDYGHARFAGPLSGPREP